MGWIGQFGDKNCLSSVSCFWPSFVLLQKLRRVLLSVTKKKKLTRTRLAQKTRKEAQKKPSSDKGIVILAQTLHDCKRNAGDCAKQQLYLATESVREKCDKRQRDDFSEWENSIHKPEDRAFGVSKVLLPLSQGLETVHHGPCIRPVCQSGIPLTNRDLKRRSLGKGPESTYHHIPQMLTIQAAPSK